MPAKALSQEQLQETVAAVEKYGGVVAAANALGVNSRTFDARYRRATASVRTTREKELEKLIARQQKRIDELSKKRYAFPKLSPRSAKGAYVRLVIPDTHGCFADSAAVAAFLHDAEYLSPLVREVVWLGDHLDCGGFLAEHFTLGYVAEAGYTFENDVDATNTLLDRVQGFCGKAQHHYLEGNHERRIERFCITKALRNHTDAAYLKKLFSVGEVLHLSKRGIALYQQGQFYHGCRLPSTIRLGKCYFTHGNRTGTHAARAMLADFGANVVFGHIHRPCSYLQRTVGEGEMGSWCPGALCRLQPLWNDTQITGWGHGYAVQFVDDDGGFLHLNIPIIEGVSYLTPLLKHLKAA